MRLRLILLAALAALVSVPAPAAGDHPLPPLPPAEAGHALAPASGWPVEPAGAGDDHPTLAYDEAERDAWLAQCRSRIPMSLEHASDPCGDYLSRYEAGASGQPEAAYSAYSAYPGPGAARGCGGCVCSGGCGCVSYRFVPPPPRPAARLHPRPKTIRRIITTEEWVEEEPPREAAPARPARSKTVPASPPAPAKPVPVGKTAAPRPVK